MVTPLFKTLSDDSLRTEYRGWREIAYNASRIAQSAGPRGRSRMASQTGRALRNMEIIEALARGRGISLAVAP